MNIIFFVSNLSYPPTEGAHAQSLKLMSQLIKNGVQVTLQGFIKKDSQFIVSQLKKDIPNLQLGGIKFYSSNYVLLAITNAIKFHSILTFPDDVDIIHFEGFGVMPLVKNIDDSKTHTLMSLIDPWALRHKNKMLSSKSVIKKPVLFISWLISYLFEYYYLPKFNKVHLVSSSDIKKVSLNYPSVKFESIPIAFDTNLVEKSNYTINNKLKILFWGDLNVSYLADGLDSFIKIINTFTNFDLEISILGRITKDDYIKKYSVNANNYIATKFIEWVDDLNTFIPLYDCVVLTDKSGTGLKNRAISSMMLGMPLIASNAALDGIEGEDSKHFFKCYTDTDYIDALSLIYSSHSLRTRMGTAASTLAKENYSTDSVTAKWLNMYRNLIHGQ